MELKGKNVLITGSATRLGKYIALALAGEGAHIILHYHTSKEKAHHTLKEIKSAGGTGAMFKADLRKVVQIQSLISKVIDDCGQLDVLINSASVFFSTPISSITERDWDTIIGTNLRGAFFCSQYAGVHMTEKGGGKIINISDIGGIVPWKNYAPYCIAKAGIIAMTKAMAKEFAPSITVNAIAPGNILPPDTSSQDEINQLASKTLLKRMGQPKDIAECIKYLLKTDFVTGSIFVIDGGQLLAPLSL
ncbi:MAG: hypothetical protein A2Y62_05565 [Candidatus Fischerbacteria bacterium RBG_13_37_8]|uniref:Short-chain dehydrogenase n=1 Tax=Candidatus Fischerbacteria bacterium RBG_13_37_8 TaxID=1817863 RepID=A0A1F5VXB0_9BACT|nr:MAG: hypothetical protein A2Y62_05565 [Candidatus Fischerbacteria bacterium RBG_13_37_8]